MMTLGVSPLPRLPWPGMNAPEHERAEALVQQDPFADDLIDRLTIDFRLPIEFAQAWVSQEQSWARSQGATEADPVWVFPILRLPIEERAQAFEGLAAVLNEVGWSSYLERFCAADPVDAPDQAQQMRDRARHALDKQLAEFRAMRRRARLVKVPMLCHAAMTGRTPRRSGVATHAARSSASASDDSSGESDGDSADPPVAAAVTLRIAVPADPNIPPSATSPESV